MIKTTDTVTEHLSSPTSGDASTALPAGAPEPGIYRHYKGSLYQVMGMARHSENEEWLVVYQALYGERGFWLRPLTLWLEPVTSSAAAGSVDSESVNSESVNSGSVNSDEARVRFSLLETNALSLQSVIKPG